MPSPRRSGGEPDPSLTTDRRWLGGLAALLVLMTVGVMATAIVGSSIQTGVRAFVGGEGSWSKAQKNAVIHLQRFLATGETAEHDAYESEIAVIHGDRQARLELEKPTPDMAVVTAGFLAGGVAADDIPAMAMVFRTFREVSYIDDAIRIWADGDTEIDRLDAIATEIEVAVAAGDQGAPGPLDDALLASNRRLTSLEADFSETLGEGARWVQAVLLVVMASILAVLVGISAVLGRFMVRRLRAADLRAADLLRASEARLRLLLEHLPAIAWTTDRDLIVTSMTGDGLTRLGIDGSALVGRSLASVINATPEGLAEDRAASLRAHDDAVAGQSAGYRTRLGGRTLQVHVAPLQVDGGTIGVIGVALDLTDRLELEARLERSSRLESIGRLAGGVAHDFNNLLTAITGYADLLTRSLPEGDQRHDAEEIQRAAHRAAGLTGQLLAFGRRAELRLDLVATNDVVDEMQDMIGRLLGSDVILDVDLAPNLPLVMADPGQLEQVVLNLAMNASDAMPTGGRLTIRTHAATMPGPADGRADAPSIDAVAIRVSDTGIGMDAATQARIFEPFFTTKSRGKGTGLGLSTAYGIVEQTGGSISVESAPGRGSTFTILLAAAAPGAASRPVVAADGARVGGDDASPEAGEVTSLRTPLAAPPPSLEGPSGASPAGDGRTADDRRGERPVILVAEDEPAVRQLVVQVLTHAGYEVVAASDGREALRVADRQPWIDGVVSDVIMAHVNGPQLVIALRSRRPDLPVLFMSGFTGDALDERAAIGGDVDLLGKPFKTSELLARVRSMLGEVEPPAA